MEEANALVDAITKYGFPIIMAVGMGYFIFFIWQFISEKIDPALQKMHVALIRVIDQTRMLDQDMIRLQQKVNVVLEYRQRQEVLKDAEEKNALKNLQEKKTTKR